MFPIFLYGWRLLTTCAHACAPVCVCVRARMCVCVCQGTGIPNYKKWDDFSISNLEETCPWQIISSFFTYSDCFSCVVKMEDLQMAFILPPSPQLILFWDSWSTKDTLVLWINSFCSLQPTIHGPDGSKWKNLT